MTIWQIIILVIFPNDENNCCLKIKVQGFNVSFESTDELCNSVGLIYKR